MRIVSKRSSRINKENIEKLVTECASISEIVLKIGLTVTSYNIKRVKNKIHELGIDFERDNSCFGNHRQPISEILVKNSTYKNNYRLKIRLVDEKLLTYVCECGNKGEWENKKLSLQLHHINGINNDNRIENLIFLCPNCHSQTLNYCGKNMSN